MDTKGVILHGVVIGHLNKFSFLWVNWGPWDDVNKLYT